MRDLTRSMMRLGWVLPLFAARQMSHLASPKEWTHPEKTAQALDAVSAAASGQLGNGMKQAYEAGERFQKSAIDMVFGAMTRGRDCASGRGDCGSWSPWGQGASGGGDNASPGQPPSSSPGHGGDPAHPSGGDTSAQGWGPVPADG